ncbi:hypothetical protein [Phocicoccus pinnipedialis]|uniref:Cbb3-type cytochrome c oxidase subunit I n=1 Tax=Phocicoccus pinnipedialis TaxID=110845 RepID=A0A6V7R5R1_9BACL|nr:hypothetical protein [Jeotgalicoccus pinnipedialis]MBP1939762.1 hypothetical protein [Jeotgalicoccus pinnipedialis]CAD2072384.1 hypothetical protein JEOPIN946_00484 [Jeotgalicoccus pinnipedialis]
MHQPAKLLLVCAGLFGLIGAFLGSHLAGAGDYAMRPIHAHILVVGWLSLFSWAVYYKVFATKYGMLEKLHVWSAITGSFGLTIGMYINNVLESNVFTLIVYIVGGSILLLSFIIFFIQTLLYKPVENK